MRISSRELICLCTFARELEKLGFSFKREDEDKFIFEKGVFFNETVLLYKNLILVATSNYKEVFDAFDLAFNMTTIEDTDIEAPLEEGENFVDLVNRLNRITKSFQKTS